MTSDDEKSQRWTGRRLVLIGVSVLAIGALYALWVLDAIRDARDEPRTAVIAATTAVGHSDLRLDAWVNDSQVVAGQTLSFWLAIQNTSQEASISGVKVISFERPGFAVPREQLRSHCWTPLGPTCINTSTPSSRFIALTLQPRESRTIEGQLVAGSEAGHYSMSAVVEWRDAKGVTRRKPISVGPVSVENSGRAQGLIAAHAAQQFLKDLALPIALALLAFVLNQIEQGRATARQKAAEREANAKLDAAQKAVQAQADSARIAADAAQKAAIHAALVQQTWTLMLPKAHANAEKHYMPLAANAALVDEHYPADRELTFFFYLRFFGGMRQLIRDIGGFYLKNRDGEWLLSNLWDPIRSRADRLFTRVAREQAQDAVGTIMTQDAFQKLGLTVIDEMRERFIIPENYDALAVHVALLRVFRIILEYEMNDVYGPWYDVPEPFPKEELRKAMVTLESHVRTGALTSQEYGTIAERMSAYLDSPRAKACELQ